VHEQEVGHGCPTVDYGGLRGLRLDPGGSGEAALRFAAEDLRVWDDGWVVESGEYTVELGWSSADLVRSTAVTVQ